MEVNEVREKIIGCATEAFAPVHEAQVLTYMKFADKNIGLLISFNVTLLKNGLKRYIY
ncbi:MAG: GxxExxY protein [Bacteroidales bacterium]|nr:GxxExxY protein [Bacteroidales bacterium]